MIKYNISIILIFVSWLLSGCAGPGYIIPTKPEFEYLKEYNAYIPYEYYRNDKREWKDYRPTLVTYSLSYSASFFEGASLEYGKKNDVLPKTFSEAKRRYHKNLELIDKVNYKKRLAGVYTIPLFPLYSIGFFLVVPFGGIFHAIEERKAGKQADKDISKFGVDVIINTRNRSGTPIEGVSIIEVVILDY